MSWGYITPPSVSGLSIRYFVDKYGKKDCEFGYLDEDGCWTPEEQEDEDY